MKLTSGYKIFFLCAAVLSSTVLVSAYITQSDIACQHSESQLVAQCVQGEQQSWFSWIRGESRSTQFHFVDLLELLNRLSPAK
ncbi:hypothetical protein MN202_06365 [Rheinheimera muenzenbergensis]|uniref:Uncharacterized protein n=1 Tax=Rheinheimera muenzenbergensis TaxID=1193628 RepID=A0ABU8C4K9_9GAMM|nr:hypothetical protein [Gammaproteobacteria bacterium]MBU1555990.1 hypothetical protein [Gammaproteobacteria bacterium]MBU2070375.1 hypothetical protein [Gammaproteobacteria bacterium]MBU2184763.1 hypothetical protein [Gammaproteobacteria bacterium]MBU2203678.1 hypothetical protein [Gammaproteobacteria bacterium]